MSASERKDPIFERDIVRELRIFIEKSLSKLDAGHALVEFQHRCESDHTEINANEEARAFVNKEKTRLLEQVFFAVTRIDMNNSKDREILNRWAQIDELVNIIADHFNTHARLCEKLDFTAGVDKETQHRLIHTLALLSFQDQFKFLLRSRTDINVAEQLKKLEKSALACLLSFPDKVHAEYRMEALRIIKAAYPNHEEIQARANTVYKTFAAQQTTNKEAKNKDSIEAREKEEQVLQDIWSAVRANKPDVLKKLMRRHQFQLNSVNPKHTEYKISLDYGSDYTLCPLQNGLPNNQANCIYLDESKEGLQYHVPGLDPHTIPWSLLSLPPDLCTVTSILNSPQVKLKVLEIISKNGHADVKHEEKTVYVKTKLNADKKGCTVLYRVNGQRCVRDVEVLKKDGKAFSIDEKLTQENLTDAIEQQILQAAIRDASIKSSPQPLAYYAIEQDRPECLRTLIEHANTMEQDLSWVMYRFEVEKLQSKYYITPLYADTNWIYIPQNKFLCYSMWPTSGSFFYSLPSLVHQNTEILLADVPDDKLKITVLRDASARGYVDFKVPAILPFDQLTKPFRRKTLVETAFELGRTHCIRVLLQSRDPRLLKETVDFILEKLKTCPEHPSIKKFIKFCLVRPGTKTMRVDFSDKRITITLSDKYVFNVEPQHPLYTFCHETEKQFGRSYAFLARLMDDKNPVSDIEMKEYAELAPELFTTEILRLDSSMELMRKVFRPDTHLGKFYRLIPHEFRDECIKPLSSNILHRQAVSEKYLRTRLLCNPLLTILDHQEELSHDILYYLGSVECIPVDLDAKPQQNLTAKIIRDALLVELRGMQSEFFYEEHIDTNLQIMQKTFSVIFQNESEAVKQEVADKIASLIAHPSRLKKDKEDELKRKELLQTKIKKNVENEDSKDAGSDSKDADSVLKKEDIQPADLKNMVLFNLAIEYGNLSAFKCLIQACQLHHIPLLKEKTLAEKTFKASRIEFFLALVSEPYSSQNCLDVIKNALDANQMDCIHLLIQRRLIEWNYPALRFKMSEFNKPIICELRWTGFSSGDKIDFLNQAFGSTNKDSAAANTNPSPHRQFSLMTMVNHSHAAQGEDPRPKSGGP